MAASTAFLHITLFGHGNGCWACQIFPKVSLLFFSPEQSSLSGFLAECGNGLDPLWAQMLRRSLVSLWCIFNEVEALWGPGGEMAMWLCRTPDGLCVRVKSSRKMHWQTHEKSISDWWGPDPWNIIFHYIGKQAIERKVKGIRLPFTQKWNLLSLMSFKN